VKADTLFETITDELIDAIEAGAGEWRMPWHTFVDAGTPTSIDGRAYRTGALRIFETGECSLGKVAP